MFPDIKKAIDFVIVFLPGFLCIGIVTYTTGIEINDFRLTYIAAVLALGIYFGCDFIIGLSSKFLKFGWIKSEFLFFLITTISAYVLAQVIIYAYENDTFFNFISTDTVSRKSPWGLIFYDMGNEQMLNSDSRPNLNVLHKDEKPFLRIQINDSMGYEGFAKWYTEKEDQYDLYLSPACVYRLNSNSRDFDIEKVNGPGVFLKGEVINTVELIDISDSGCRQLYFPEQK